MQINFIDLAQMSLDFAKNIRSFITRVNKKKSKKKRSSNYTPPAVDKVKEEEILATEAIELKATIESNIKLKTTIEFNIANITQLTP
jgi:hypothetical protein